MTDRGMLWLWVIAIITGMTLAVISFRLDPVVHQWQQGHNRQNIRFLSHHVTPDTAKLTRFVTRGTDWPTHLVLGLILVGFASWRGNKKWTRIFLSMLLAAALAGIAAYSLKFTTGRVRPSVKVEKVWGGPDARQNFQSFPSGHSAFSAGFF